MTRYSRKRQAALLRNDQAMIFADYEDLNDHIAPYHGSPLLVVTELLEAVRKHLAQRFDLKTAHVQAYADFSALDEDGLAVQKRLQNTAAEPRFVSTTAEEAAVPMQLSLDASDALYSVNASTYVLVTARRPYGPLVRHLRRHGRRVFVFALAVPPEDAPADEDLTYVDALELLPPTMRSRLEPLSRRGTHHKERSGHPPAARPPANRPPHTEITDPGLLDALRIIEDYFGQYEEVYLTPLLRKLSELMDEEEFDPKDLISGLEEAGAVWLEKRPAHPHDYTVLLVDDKHPDVVAVRKKLEEEVPDGDDYPLYLEDGQADEETVQELASEDTETDGPISDGFDEHAGDGFDENHEPGGLTDGY